MFVEQTSMRWGPARTIAPLQPRSAPFIGREHELHNVQHWLQEAQSGRPAVVLVQGDAGVGKTRLLKEIRLRAEHAGFLVCAGRAYEHLALPYLPFAESLFTPLLRHAETESDIDSRDVAVITQLLHGEAPLKTEDGPASPDDDGHRTLQQLLAITRMTLQLARSRPLLVTLDDLQWADQASLTLFSHLVFSLGEMSQQTPLPLLLLAAYRPAEPEERWRQTVTRFQREEQCHTFVLPDFNADEVRALLQHTGVHCPSQQLVTAIHTVTHGNPLWVQEAVKHLLAAHALEERGGYITMTVDPSDLYLPQELALLMAARIQRVNPRLKEMLTLAALLGRRGSLSTLQGISQFDNAETLDLLTLAVRQRLLVAEGDRFEFVHPLMCQVLVTDLLPVCRQRLHGRIAQMLTTRLVTHDIHTIGEIAFHLTQAGPEADATIVMDYARMAADQAFAVGAWDEAARYYEVTLVAVARSQSRTANDSAELHYRAGLARYRAMDVGPCLDHFEKALSEYQERNDVEGMARVLMTRTRAYMTQAAVPYGTLMDLQVLENIVDHLTEEQLPLRGQILATLAEAYWIARQTTRARALAERARDIGQQLADASLSALANHVLALTHTQQTQPHEALALWSSARDFARQAQDPWLELWPLTRMPWMLLTLGRLHEAETLAREACSFAQRLHNWAEYSFALATLVGIAVLQGEFDEAERLGREVMLMVQRSHYPWGSVRALPALAGGRVLRGAWQEAYDAIAQLIEPGQLFAEPGPALHAVAQVYQQLIAARADAREEAIIEGRQHSQLQAQKKSVEQGAVARLCAKVELSELRATPQTAATPYPVLAHVAAQGVVFTTEWPYLLPRVLGVAAAANQCWERAAAHFEEARDIAQRLGARPEYGLSCLDYARMLTRRDQADDCARALTLVTEAVEVFTELRMTPFLHDAHTLVAQLQGAASTVLVPSTVAKEPQVIDEHPISLPDLPADPLLPCPVARAAALNVFRLEGDHWKLSYHGKTCLLKDLKGLYVIAYLLRYPNQHFDAALLNTLSGRGQIDTPDVPLSVIEEHAVIRDGLRVGTLSDTGTVLDGQARAAYRQRLAELQADLAEAERCHDLGRIDKIRAEREFLLAELRAATGLGGRARKTNSPDERARLGVKKAITVALRHMATKHSPLAQHLMAHLRTGVRCSYVCDPTRPLSWVV